MTARDGAPARREVWAIVSVAVALRVAVFCCVVLGWQVSVREYASKGDGESYLAMAGAMGGERGYGELKEYDRRVFPGYPAIIAAVHRGGMPLEWAALIITWISAGVAAGVGALVFSERRVGWGMTILIPHFLINSSMAMSEGPLLALTVCGLWAGMNAAKSGEKAGWLMLVLAGVLLGCAGLVRPMACFAVAGLVLWGWRKGMGPRVWIAPLAAAAVVLAGVAAMHCWTGDALQGVRVYRDNAGAYAGHMLQWPMHALLATPFHEQVGWGKLVHIWAHVVAALGACGALVVQWARRRKEADPLVALALPWLAGNTLFELCVGSPWGFRHFPRFMLPALPAFLWAGRSVLVRRWVWIGIGAALVVVAVFGVKASP